MRAPILEGRPTREKSLWVSPRNSADGSEQFEPDSQEDSQTISVARTITARWPSLSSTTVLSKSTDFIDIKTLLIGPQLCLRPTGNFKGVYWKGARQIPTEYSVGVEYRTAYVQEGTLQRPLSGRQFFWPQYSQVSLCRSLTYDPCTPPFSDLCFLISLFVGDFGCGFFKGWNGKRTVGTSPNHLRLD